VETAKRQRALLGSLTESALGRPLLHTEHTALETTVLGSTTPIPPMVVDTIRLSLVSWQRALNNERDQVLVQKLCEL
jgi:hypothetical protein